MPDVDPTMIILLVIGSLGIVANILCVFVLFRKRMKSSFNTILLGLTLFDLLLLMKTVFTALNKLTVSTKHPYHLMLFPI